MNKKLFPILITVGTLVLGGCGGGEESSSSSDEGPAQLEALAISNKAALQAAWSVGDDNRTIEFTMTPEINITEEINSGNLVVSSSNAAVANVIGRVVMPVALGNATISVAYLEHVWDTVEITITEAETNKYLISEIYDLANEAAVAFDGVYLGHVNGPSAPVYSQGIFVGDDEHAVMVFGAQAIPAGAVIGDTFTVEGKVSIYKGLYEIAEATLELAAESTAVAPATLVYDGSSDLTVEDQSLPIEVTGVAKSKTVDPTYGNVTLVLTVGTKELEVRADARYVSTAILNELTAVNVDDNVTVEGFVGWYNKPQIIAITSVDAQADDRVLSSIAVTTEPTKKTYSAGESFDPAGMVVTATYDDSSTENVTSKCTFAPDPLTEGLTEVTVSYTKGAVTKTATVSGLTVSHVDESVLLAKYDLSDVVRTPYTDGLNSKYLEGTFATFLSTKLAAGGTDNLASSTGETNVYTAAQSASTTSGPQFNGIKFGKSDAGAAVTLSFDAGTNITKVVLGCAGWASPNTDTLSINGAVKTPIQGGVSATVEAVEFVITASDSVSIVTTKRIIFNYISVYVTAV